MLTKVTLIFKQFSVITVGMPVILAMTVLKEGHRECRTLMEVHFADDNLATKFKQHYFNQLKDYKREASQRQHILITNMNSICLTMNITAMHTDLPGSRTYRDKMKWKGKVQSTRNKNSSNNRYESSNNRKKKSPFSAQNYKVTKNKRVQTHPLDFPRSSQNNRTNDYSSQFSYNRDDFPKGPKNKRGRSSSNKSQRNGRY